MVYLGQMIQQGIDRHLYLILLGSPVQVSFRRVSQFLGFQQTLRTVTERTHLTAVVAPDTRLYQVEKVFDSAFLSIFSRCRDCFYLLSSYSRISLLFRHQVVCYLPAFFRPRFYYDPRRTKPDPRYVDVGTVRRKRCAEPAGFSYALFVPG